MPNIVNKLSLTQLTSAWSEAEGLLFFSMAGLTMEENEELRGAIFESGAQVRLVRNRLAVLALASNGHEVDSEIFKGNVAVAWGDAESTIGAAKVVTGSKLKKAGKLDVRGGMLEGNLLGASDAAALSDVPDRPTLQAKLLGCISGPAQGLVRVINGNPSGLARLIQARIDAGGEE
ncbi:MAG: 50S ribosomal protein L10 [Planctomycetota bacterium]|nr:50S ribosomal protein L10 [Planctomycetota bacterium]